MSVDLKQLKNVENRINNAITLFNQNRNEEDRKYIVSQIGKDLAKILTPLLMQIAQNSRLTAEEIKAIIANIKVEAPNVKVEQPRIEVSSPEVKVPEIKIPEIKIPQIRVPVPRVTVKAPEVNIPKEMEVKGLKGLIKNIADALKKKPKIEFNQDKPLEVILTDEDGNKYKALSKMIGGGGGLASAVQIRGNTGIGTGIKTVTTAGTPVPITTSNMPIKRVFVQALDTNTGLIVVGGPSKTDVDATAATRKGIALYASQGQWFNIDNLKLLWLDSTVDGEKAHYLYEV